MEPDADTVPLQVVSGQVAPAQGTIRDGAAVPSPRRFDLNGRWQELRAHLTVPLYRNAYALMLNTGVTGLLGLLYWLLAARHYTPVEVGRASALYSAMNLLSGFTAYNLIGAVTRFIPQSGRHTRTFVLRIYLFSSLASVIVTIPFLLVVRHWGPSYAQLGALIPGLAFVVCVIAWGIFTLQDGVLTGLRSAPWVPLENGTFGVVKIVLLVALAATIPAAGIDISWMLPVIVSLPLINLLIFAKLMPRHQLLTRDRQPPSVRQVGRFLAGDYTGGLCMLAISSLVPIVVAVRLGPGLSAYFYVAWMVGGVLDLLAVNMATSLTVEGAFDSQTLAANCRSALRRTLFILVPAAALVAALARPALDLYGPRYAAYGAPILELLALATLPKTLTELYLGALRAQSRTRLIAVIQVTRCVLILGLALGLTAIMGVVGAGIAALATQAFIALLILPGLRRVLAGTGSPPAATRPQAVPATTRQEGPAATGWVQLPGTAMGPVELPTTEVEFPTVELPWPAEHAEPDRLAQSAGPGAQRTGVEEMTVHDPVVAKTGGAGPPVSPDPGRLNWLPTAALSVMTAAGVVLFFAPLGQVTRHLGQISSLGLISITPAATLAGIALLALTFILALGLTRPKPALLAATLVAIVVCLDGVTSIAEPEPRFPTAYWIAGFVDYVSRTGHTAPDLSAYFSWPGFFYLVALAEHVAGSSDLIPVLRFWPLAVDLLALVPMGLIINRMQASWRAKWFALFIFSVGNWVGQDYFSPQSFNYLLYLFFIALLVTYFGRKPATDHPAEAEDRRGGSRGARRRPAGRGLWWRAILTRPIPGDLPAVPASRKRLIVMLGLIIAIFVFSTSSHQLTPFFMVVASAGLVIAGRCRLRGLPILLGVIFAAWISFAAVPYWSGHLSEMFSGFGNLGSNLSTSVSGRMVGSTALHKLVLYSRTAFAGAVLFLAAMGLMRRRRLAFDDRIALLLMCVPFAGFGLQNYGGEIALRVYMFALPGACLLAAYLFFPGPARDDRAWRSLTGAKHDYRAWRVVPAAAMCAIAAVLLFFVARYGNEAFERTPPGELSAMNYLYAHDHSGIRVVWLSEQPAVDDTPQMPWQYRDLSTTDYIPELAPTSPTQVSGLVSGLRAMGPDSYIITTTTQETYLEQAASYPAGWGQQFRAAMRSYPGVKVAFSDSDAAVYTLTWPAGTRMQPLPPVTTSPGRPTVWTPIGLAELSLLLLVLAAREVTRIWPLASRRLARILAMAPLPLLIAFALIVIVRFALLS